MEKDYTGGPIFSEVEAILCVSPMRPFLTRAFTSPPCPTGYPPETAVDLVTEAPHEAAVSLAYY